MASDPLDQAQELCFDAWDSDDPKTRVKFARKALSLCRDCADAYVILANEAHSLREKIELYRRGVEAGERTLGPGFFKERVGHFWGASGTRPYMRARLGLAQSLWSAGRRDDAISHFSELLHLNPNDNQGVRYPLSRHLLEENRDSDAVDILNFYENDGSADWCYTWALIAFRKEGDTEDARRSLWSAIMNNYHVPAFLLAKRPFQRVLPEEFSIGYESEAVCYAADNFELWTQTPGALDWLARRLRWNEGEGRRASLAAPVLAQATGATAAREYCEAGPRQMPAQAASGGVSRTRNRFKRCVKCGAGFGKSNTSGHCRGCGRREAKRREREWDASVERLVQACREAGDIVTGRLRTLLDEERRRLDLTFARHLGQPFTARLSACIDAADLDRLWRSEQQTTSLPALWIEVQAGVVHLKFLNDLFQTHTPEDIGRHFESALHREHPNVSVEWLGEGPRD